MALGRKKCKAAELRQAICILLFSLLLLLLLFLVVAVVAVVGVVVVVAVAVVVVVVVVGVCRFAVCPWFFFLRLRWREKIVMGHV